MGKVKQSRQLNTLQTKLTIVLKVDKFVNNKGISINFIVKPIIQIYFFFFNITRKVYQESDRQFIACFAVCAVCVSLLNKPKCILRSMPINICVCLVAAVLQAHSLCVCVCVYTCRRFYNWDFVRFVSLCIIFSIYREFFSCSCCLTSYCNFCVNTHTHRRALSHKLSVGLLLPPPLLLLFHVHCR